MNRYNFTDERIKALKKYVKKPEGRKPVLLNKHEATIQKGKLYLDGKQVIPKNKVEETLRRKILSGQIPLTRDAAFYWLSKKYVGLSRKAVDDFLKKQRIIRETDNAKAKTTATNRKVNKKGWLHLDLVEIKFSQLPVKDPIFPHNDPHPDMVDSDWEPSSDEEEGEPKGYFIGIVDSLTSAAWYRYVRTKEQKLVTPLNLR